LNAWVFFPPSFSTAWLSSVAPSTTEVINYTKRCGQGQLAAPAKRPRTFWTIDTLSVKIGGMWNLHRGETARSMNVKRSQLLIHGSQKG
jgi:hypothetical protein